MRNHRGSGNTSTCRSTKYCTVLVCSFLGFFWICIFVHLAVAIARQEETQQPGWVPLSSCVFPLHEAQLFRSQTWPFSFHDISRFVLSIVAFSCLWSQSRWEAEERCPVRAVGCCKLQTHQRGPDHSYCLVHLSEFDLHPPLEKKKKKAKHKQHWHWCSSTWCGFERGRAIVVVFHKYSISWHYAVSWRNCDSC